MSLMDILRQAGFSGSSLSTAYAVAMAESGGNARAFNGNRNTGDQSYGLFQINMLGGMGPERRRAYGLSSNDDLYDAVKNAQIAYKMSKGGKDWSPWSAYRNGSYRKYLGQSGAQVAGGGPAGSPTVGGAQPFAPPEQEQSQSADILSSPDTPSFAPQAGGFTSKPQSMTAKQVQQQTANVPTQQAAGYSGAAGSTSFRDKVIAAAMSQLGTPYSWGGGTTKGPSRGILYAGKDGRNTVGFDCSSLLQYAFAQAGYSIPRTGRPQLALGQRTSIKNLRPGDFLGWGTGGHIAMYLGNGKYIHAPSAGRTVEIKTLSKNTSAWGVRLRLPGD